MPFTALPARSTQTASRRSGAALREQAYREIKRRIIQCEFRPGQALNESQIGQALSLGRTPIHQALHRLEIEGLVAIRPRKGVIVSPLSLDDVLDMIEVRSTNEQLCVTLASERAQATDFQAMRQILAPAPALIAKRDIAALTVLDLQFHTAMSAASRNQVLADLLRGLHEKQARFWFMSLSDSHHLRDIHEEHLHMIEALQARDAQAAREAVRRHIDDFRRNIIRSV